MTTAIEETPHYTLATMPQDMFDAWMTALETTDTPQGYLYLWSPDGTVCTWGVYLETQGMPKNEHLGWKALEDNIESRLLKYVINLNDTQGLSFSAIAKRLKSQRKRAIHRQDKKARALIIELYTAL